MLRSLRLLASDMNDCSDAVWWVNYFLRVNYGSHVLNLVVTTETCLLNLNLKVERYKILYFTTRHALALEEDAPIVAGEEISIPGVSNSHTILDSNDLMKWLENDFFFFSKTNSEFIIEYITVRNWFHSFTIILILHVAECKWTKYNNLIG